MHKNWPSYLKAIGRRFLPKYRNTTTMVVKHCFEERRVFENGLRSLDADESMTSQIPETPELYKLLKAILHALRAMVYLQLGRRELAEAEIQRSQSLVS